MIDNTYVKYIGGGLLGDFIQQLSVVKEMYIQTGKKGIVYISNNVGDRFRNNIEQTYQELTELLTQNSSNYVDYIQEFKIYQGEEFDINLSVWRRSHLLYHTNWRNIYNSTFGVNWGLNKWIDISAHYDAFSDKILINYSSTRPYHGGIDFSLYDQDKLIFIGFNNQDYKLFRRLSGLNIPFYNAKNLHDLAIAINSCSLFIGGLSSPLALCLSMHKKCIAHFKIDADGTHMKDISQYMPFVTENQV